jgi:hypothetical protein
MVHWQSAWLSENSWHKSKKTLIDVHEFAAVLLLRSTNSAQEPL